MMDAQSFTVAEWVQQTRKLHPRNEYLKHAVNLAWMLSKVLDEMLASGQVELQDINVGNVCIFVERPRRVSIFPKCDAPSSRKDVSAITAVNFLCEPPLSFSRTKSKPDEPAVCVALGRIIWKIFSYGDSNSGVRKFKNSTNGEYGAQNHGVRAAKRARSSVAQDIPQSICHLLHDLLKAEKKQTSRKPSLSLEDVIFDLGRMRSDPECYLFDRTYEKAVRDACLCGSNQEHLFGRGEEMEALNCIRERFSSHVNGTQVRGGQGNKNFLFELVFLGGYPGFGKSKIQSSFADVVQSQGWICLKIKFEEGVSSIALLAKAFDHFFRQLRPGINTDLILSKRETLRQVCQSISCALDYDSLSQVCEFIPSLRVALSLFGMANSQSDQRFSGVDDYESANKRRMYLFHVLFRCLASTGRPVLIAMDDMHWCDGHILEGMMDFVNNYVDSIQDERKRGILFSGTYRSNVEQNVFTQALSTLRDDKNLKATLIPVHELSQGDTNEMISSKLGLPLRHTQALASVVQSKTRGCPFHIVQFLKCIIQNGMLTFSANKRRWIWDTDTIDMQIISDDVANLLAATLSKLPRQLMQTVKIISCVGYQIEEATIDALNCGNKLLSFDMHEQLVAAVKEGILEKAGPVYQFTHDLLKQNIYDTINEKARKLLHKTIGQTLLESDTRSPHIHLVAVDQINIFCNDCDPSQEERPSFTKHLLQAAKIALKESNFEQAQIYCNAGLKLLDDNHWQSQYSLSLQLYELAASVSCAHGDTNRMKEHISNVLANAKSFEDGLHSSFLLMQLLGASSQYAEAISTGIGILSKLGEDFPQDIRLPLVMKELSLAEPTLRAITSERLQNLPTMTNTSKLAAMKFMRVLCRYMIISRPVVLPLFAIRMVRLTFEHGICDDSIVGIVMAGHGVLAMKEDIKLAYQLSKVTEPLIRESPNCHALRAKCSGFECASRVIVEPAQAYIKILLESHNSAMLTGDVENSLKLYQYYVTGCFHTSAELLPAVTRHVAMCLQKARKFKQNTVMYVAMSFLNACVNLTGQNEIIDKLKVKSYFDLDKIAEQTSSKILRWQNSLNQMGEALFMRDFELVTILSENFSLPNQQPSAKYKRVTTFNRVFYEGLANLNLARAHPDDDKKRRIGEESVDYFANMAKNVSQWNFENKSKLLQAELHFLNGSIDDAERVYNEAIRAAQAHKFLHEEALCCEFYGMFLLANVKVGKGLEQLQLALTKYKKWGATRKVNSLQHYIDNLDNN